MMRTNTDRDVRWLPVLEGVRPARRLARQAGAVAAWLVVCGGLVAATAGCQSGFSLWGPAKPRPVSIDDLPPPPTSFAEKPAASQIKVASSAHQPTGPAAVVTRPSDPGTSPYGREPGDVSTVNGPTAAPVMPQPMTPQTDPTYPGGGFPGGSSSGTRTIIRGQSPDAPRVSGPMPSYSPTQVMPSVGPSPRVSSTDYDAAVHGSGAAGPGGYGPLPHGVAPYGPPGMPGGIVGSVGAGMAGVSGGPVPFGMATQRPQPLPPSGTLPMSRVPYGVAPTLPLEAWTGPPTSIDQWRPPGIAGPWPYDEYLHDGGDGGVEARVTPNLSVTGLEAEDTVILGENGYGRTLIEPSNRVTIYAPRFAAVRQVRGLVAAQASQPVGQAAQPIGTELTSLTNMPAAASQPIELHAARGQKNPITFERRESAGRVGGVLPVRGLASEFATYENFLVMRTGGFNRTEGPMLMKMADAALVWQDEQAVQVIVEEALVTEQKGLAKAEVAYTYERFGKPALRIIKVADKRAANPGDIVRFTLRYDNVGADPMTNVSILDNLTTRLTYVADSTESSRETVFTVQENEAQSLVLKWTLTEPLPPGQGGVIRFQCRVR